MTQVNSTTNGASLEDCHTNFFSLTDVCGIKWTVLRSSSAQSPNPGDPLEDPILLSFTRCLEAGLLAVWRRVPRRQLVTYSFDPAGNQVKKSVKGHDEKNQLSQVKELWLFWYGEKPESVTKLCSPDLREVEDSSPGTGPGSWESGIPYEARTLLFKAVNNLIERSLLSKQFVRLGKWFVQPYDGADRPLHKGSHLSFSFQYFVHGESAVCTSVDVRQHPPVRRLAHQHLATAAGASASVQVLLAPYGMAGTLTGQHFGPTEPAVRRLLEEWAAFWPLSGNTYTARDPVSGEHTAMPAAVEVLVGGVRLVYPTSYVLVTDMDLPGSLLQGQEGEDCTEPSPFTASSHPMVQGAGACAARSASERVHTDSVLPDLDDQGGGEGGVKQEDLGGGGTQAALQGWEYRSPTTTFKRTRAKPSRAKGEREFRSARWRGGNPLFRRGESMDLAWGLDQDSLCQPSLAARIDGGGSGSNNQINNRVPSEGLHRDLQSPASQSAPHTPGGGALQATPGGGPPLSSPHTPAYTPQGAGGEGAPHTPFTPGGPKSCGPFSVPSPFRAREANQPLQDRKPDLAFSHHVSPTSSSKPLKLEASKRPALPAKEYEEATDQLSLTSAYDYSDMTAWLSHPVKKSRPTEGGRTAPLQPMYRRRSQHDIFAPVCLEVSRPLLEPKVQPLPQENGLGVKVEPKPLTNGINGDGVQVKKEVLVGAGGEEGADGKPLPSELSFFTGDGLKPSMSDLDNMFEDSDSEMLDPSGCVPTPPASVQPHITAEMEEGFTSLKAIKRDPPGNLPSDQLHQMFPTPPSHEHPSLHSPGDGIEDPRTPNSGHIKQEPISPRRDDWREGGGLVDCLPYSSSVQHPDIDSYFDHTVMLATSKFAPLPLSSLPSHHLPSLPLPDTWRYKPSPSLPPSPQPSSTQPSAPPPGPPSSLKAGQSPISPSPSIDLNPRSNKSQNPGSCDPRSVGPTTPRSHHHPLTPQHMGEAPPQTPTVSPPANALTINLVLSDSLLNLYRDINFNSCTMCVCTNDGNIKGGESLLYLPQFSAEEDHDCKCGYSAVVNRRLTHLAGMFLEDEREVTGIQEDLYYKKRLSLLLLDPKCQEQGEHRFNERAAVVDRVGTELVEAVHQQAGLSASRHSSLIAYSQQYLRSLASQPPPISYIEDTDCGDTVWSALETVRASSTADSKSDLEQGNRASCLHKWSVLPSPGPSCSEDIVRVMKCLCPILEVSLHVRAGKKTQELAVEGPLTWRQFHRMAGVTTKGNTDDGCEPLPIPSVTVGYEREWMAVSPLSLYYWDSLAMEPWAPPRDVAYIVLAPDNDSLMTEVRTFFKVLSNGYESLKLGRHASGAKSLRDGVLKVGPKMAGKLEAEPVTDDWFSAIGDCPNSELLRLYSKVCHHYLVPLLATVPLDSNLFKKEANGAMKTAEETLAEKAENGDTATSAAAEKEARDEAAISGEEGPGEPPAIVIYIVDPFSYGVDNPELMRLSNLALLRCFTNMVADKRLPSEALRQSLYLQTISLESIYSVTGESRREAAQTLVTPGSTAGSRAATLVRDLAMSVYTQSQRPLAFNTSTKTLTGFGPASAAERYLKGIEQKQELAKHLYTPPFVLALPSQKNKKTSDAEEAQRSTVLFVTYCLSDDQKHLLASLADDRGEMVRTTVININIPNRTRRKKASARRVGLKRLLDWILSVMALSLVPWRLVIGRLGRIGHGELRGWSALLSRKSLKKAVKQLKDQCTWRSDLPTLLSVCLISMEPDTVLRVMHEQFTPDERFGGNAATCTLSTPKDATATHILVFPTSATAQSAVQAAFNDHQTGDSSENDFDLGLDNVDMELNPNDDNDGLGLGDLNDIFNDDPFANAGAASPSGAEQGNEGEGEEGDEDSQLPGGDPAFRYGQEVPGERLEILQQPLALGYLVSTAATGHMPRWFWASAPHLESVCPVFLKSALHINIANLAHGGEDGLGPGPGQSRHSLDSGYTTDVLRFVLEGYNALSWLVLDPVTHDRRSCLPIHVQTLLQLYHAMAALV